MNARILKTQFLYNKNYDLKGPIWSIVVKYMAICQNICQNGCSPILKKS